MTTTEQKLNALADYQAQIDYLNLEKQRLIDDVKIPAEVQQIHDEGVRLKSQVNAKNVCKVEQIQQEEARLLAKVVIPPEIKAAYDAIEAERNEIRARLEQTRKKAMEDAQQEYSQIDAQFEAKVKDVYAGVEQRKRDIVIEFAGKEDAVNANSAKLEQEIRDEVKELKQTVKGEYFMAIYVKGRDGGWDSAKLQGYATAHPEILPFKKPDGEPSITIRKR